MCIEIILAQEPEVVREILPGLPVHLRRQVMYHTAVHAPLSADALRSLYSPDPKCGVGGELVLARSYGAGFLQRTGVVGTSSDAGDDSPAKDWDADDEPTFETDAEESRPLDTLVLLACPLSPATLSVFPSTLTHLALLALPVPLTGLHRLPGLLPLLTFLDLSFNPSLLVAIDRRERPIYRVQWARWRMLEVLGLQQCGVDEYAAAELEKKRQLTSFWFNAYFRATFSLHVLSRSRANLLRYPQMLRYLPHIRELAALVKAVYELGGQRVE